MDIVNIVENKLPEGQKLEFKKYFFEDGKFNRLLDKNKNALVKEITAFANADGGTIVIGIEEDENHNPLTLSDVGVNKENFETWEQSFRQFISAKIKPVIYGLTSKLVNYDDENLIMIEIPKSMMKPHAFDDGNKDSFHIRYGNTTNAMRLEELRSAFQDRDLLGQKIIQFRDNRLAKIYSGEVMGEIENQSLLVIHIIPEWSLGLNSYVDLKEFKENQKVDVLSPTRLNASERRRGWPSYNFEGLRIDTGEKEGLFDSYTQVFYNGIIECVEKRLMNVPSKYDQDKSIIFRWDRFEELLVEKIREFTQVLEEQNLPKPYNILVSLLNVKGKIATAGEWGDPTPSGALLQNIIKIIPAYYSDENGLEEALLPMMTNLAHVFGYEYSSLYTRDNLANSNIFSK